MERLLQQITDLKNSALSTQMQTRMEEFSAPHSEDELFSELCFCLLTANYASAPAWTIQKKISSGFAVLPRKKLAARLKSLGYRFPNVRAEYVMRARPLKPTIPRILASDMDPTSLRKWFVENIHGFGYKEASHFLRNIGRTEYAIIDFHILDVLSEHRLFETPKTLTPRRYLEAEKVLEKIANKTNMTQGELDLYLWYLETGKVLK